MHIPVQSIPHSNNNKEVQYAYSVALQHLPTSPTSPTLLQEIHTRPSVAVYLGVIENTEENEVSSWPFPQEDNIDMECISIDEGKTLEPEYSPSPNSDSVRILGFNERSRDITNKEENLEYISYIELWFQEAIKPRYHPLLQFLLLLNQTGCLDLCIETITVIFFLYVDKGIFLIFLRI